MSKPFLRETRSISLRERLSIKHRADHFVVANSPASFGRSAVGGRGFSLKRSHAQRTALAGTGGLSNKHGNIKTTGQKTGQEMSDLLQQAKLDAMKGLAYGASHEINNPLANIAARAQTLLRDERDERRRGMLEAIHRQAMRAHEMISDLMLFARPPKLERSEFNPLELAHQVAEELRLLAEQQQTTLVVSGEKAAVSADRVQIGVALKALLENSIEALGTGGEVGVLVENLAGAVQFTVRDTGPGIPAEIRDHIFDPFFSGREAGRGLGFGLSKCWRIVTEHGGSVTANSPPGEGAVFVVRLPHRNM